VLVVILFIFIVQTYHLILILLLLLLLLPLVHCYHYHNWLSFTFVHELTVGKSEEKKFLLSFTPVMRNNVSENFPTSFCNGELHSLT